MIAGLPWFLKGLRRFPPCRVPIYSVVVEETLVIDVVTFDCSHYLDKGCFPSLFIRNLVELKQMGDNSSTSINMMWIQQTSDPVLWQWWCKEWHLFSKCAYLQCCYFEEFGAVFCWTLKEWFTALDHLF